MLLIFFINLIKLKKIVQYEHSDALFGWRECSLKMQRPTPYRYRPSVDSGCCAAAGTTKQPSEQYTAVLIILIIYNCLYIIYVNFENQPK